MILALDQSSSRTGWCLGPASGPVQTGSVAFAGHRHNIASLMSAFRSWLRGMIEAHNPEIIAFEQPVRPISGSSLLTMRQLYCIAGIVELVARDKAVPVFEVNNSSMKKLIYGVGGKKPPASVGIPLASAWGFTPENMDQADACGMFLMVLKHRYPDDFMRWEHRRADIMVEKGMALA